MSLYCLPAAAAAAALLQAFLDTNNILTLLRAIAAKKLSSAEAQLSSAQRRHPTPGQAWNACAPHLVQAAEAHCRIMVYAYLCEGLASAAVDDRTRGVLFSLAHFYGLRLAAADGSGVLSSDSAAAAMSDAVRLKTGREGERSREVERGRERSREVERGRERERITEAQIHSNTQTHRHTLTHTQTHRHTHRHTKRQTDRHTHRHTQTHTNTQTHTDTDTHAHTHTHAHTDTHTHTHTHRPSSLFPVTAD